MLEIFDNKVSQIDKIYEELKDLPYYFGECDNEGDYPTGMVSPLSTNNLTYNLLLDAIYGIDALKNKTIIRSYANLFIPREIANYHIDAQSGVTLLYYANLDYDINEGGETKFLSDNNTLISVLPVPGRIVIFSANYKHTASSFKNKHRFSVAFKFKD
jgi:hypothetical protein